MSTKGRVQIAAELVAAWNDLGVRFVIVHGLDGYPATVGRDLDILVHEADSSVLLGASHQILEREGWVAIEPPDMWGKRIVAFSGVEALEVHTVSKLSWREIDLVSHPDPARRWKDVFPVDPWASYAKQILMPGFHGDLKKVSSNLAGLSLVGEDRQLIRRRLRALVMPGDEDLADKLLEGSARDLEGLLASVRVSMVRRSWSRAPFSALRSVSRKVGQRADGLVRSTGVTIQLIAAEAIEPAEVRQWVNSNDRSIFTDFVFRMPVSRSTQSRIGLLTDALKGVWLRLIGDRVALSGQRVVFHIAKGSTNDRVSSDAIARLSRWLDRTGSQPQAILVIRRSRTANGSAGMMEVSGEKVGDDSNGIVRVATESFVRRHSLANRGAPPVLFDFDRQVP